MTRKECLTLAREHLEYAKTWDAAASTLYMVWLACMIAGFATSNVVAFCAAFVIAVAQAFCVFKETVHESLTGELLEELEG